MTANAFGHSRCPARSEIDRLDSYEDAALPSGYPVGTPEEALDCACGLYLNGPTAWTKPPTN